MSGIFSGFRFAFVSLENKYFDWRLVGEDFFGFCVYWLVLGGTLPYFRSFGMNTLAAVPAKSLGNKDLEVTYLFLKDLASFALRISALGPLPLLPPGVGPPFHPEQKVKLDKSEATRGGPFPSVMTFWAMAGTDKPLPC
ncbi:MAG: hypothetical protein ABSD64_10335 [Terriglobales bacterium]|jgi:hypothetical protein